MKKAFFSFGLVASLTILIVVTPVWNTEFWERRFEGFYIHVLKPDAYMQKDGFGAEPVIIRLEDAGPGSLRNLYVNSLKVSRQDLYNVLKEKLSKRAEWVVYVEADSTLSWEEVVEIMDVVRELHAKVFLITSKTQLKP